jgi:hypothetical protein
MTYWICGGIIRKDLTRCKKGGHQLIRINVAGNGELNGGDGDGKIKSIPTNELLK